MAFQENVLHGVPLTRESFQSPPLEMGIVPFWFWNGDMEPGEMEWQLRQYHDRGVRSLFIHGRMGLNVPYGSDEWFARVKVAVQLAKEIGIDAWVYDEMDWPSGTAGRQVMKAAPELSQRYLELVALHIRGPLFTFLEAQDNRYVNTGDSNPIAAYGVRQEEWRSEIREVVDLNRNLSFRKTIPWEAPEGDWVLLYFLEKEDPYYIDTLNPASTEKFLELTHERYREAVGEEFGKTVPGFFTDEPAMYYYHVGMNNYVIPWSRQMFKIFRDLRGYDLKPHLPALYASVGADTARIRYDFWRTVSERYTETYYRRIRDWCDENGVIFTGHLLFEEWLRLSARCEGNIFKHLEQMHLIGVDHLYPKIGSVDEPAEHVALKLGSSAAHHYGSTRLLCESMGGTYWNCTLERMKWMNNWEYVLGVNLFNNHGYHYTIEGERKRDWPPSQFYHHTWWKYYDRFTAYNARLSHLLSGGRHVARVLMLYPINSIWTNYTPQARSRVSGVVEDEFNFMTDALLRLHFDFDYVDEDVLAGARVEDGRLHVADEEFEVLLLPPVTHIKKQSWAKIAEFVAAGGRVVADQIVPVGLLDDEGGPVADVDFFGIDAQALLRLAETGEGGTPAVTRHGPEGRVQLVSGARLSATRDTGTLDAVLRASVAPDVEIDREEVFYLHRQKDGFDVYFLVNTTQSDLGNVEIRFEQTARPEIWNPNTGETVPLDVFRLEGGRLVVDLAFPPAEAHVVVLRGALPRTHAVRSTLLDLRVTDGQVSGYAAAGAASAELATPDGTLRVEAAARPARPDIVFPDRMAFGHAWDNVLPVAEWRLHVGEGPADAFADPAFDDFAWLPVTHGAWETQLPEERDGADYPVELWYRTTFRIDHMPERLTLLVDGFAGSDHTLYVNGREVADRGERSWLDAEMRAVDILPFAEPGRNLVTVRLVARRRTDGILDLLKLTGPFGVHEAGGEAGIGAPVDRVAVGDWTGQGFPFYSGSGLYTAEVQVPAEYLDGGRLWLEADPGEDVMEVSVNGSEGRVAPWHPYRVDVTDLLRPGANFFTISVTNTLLNILEAVPQASGLRSAPRLRHEHRFEIPFTDGEA
jgi:hypothetical protein